MGAGLVAALGWALLEAPSTSQFQEVRSKPRFGWLLGSFADALARLSYDLPFVVRGKAQALDIAVVYIDENAALALKQPMPAWDRQLHAQLVRRLTRAGARAVFFDIVFVDDWPDPAVDRDFADAIRENGRVILGAGLEIEEGEQATQERIILPMPSLRQAAMGWGLLTFRPIDADYCVRQIYTGSETVPSATWRAAFKLDAGLTDTAEARAEPRWVNYYGPADSFPNVGYDRALDPDGVPPDFFRDRIVFVGGRSTLSELRLGKDDFRNPYGLLGRSFSKGVEIHATILQNLLRHEWLRRLAAHRELSLVIGVGVLLGAGLPLFRPHAAALLAVVATLGMAGFACWLFAAKYIWFSWCVPAFVQVPVALAWAIGARYFLEERRRRALRSAFRHYLSEQMADRIADAEFDLRPGGVVVEASVLMTDLEGFTGLSERLDDPERLTELLTKYFSQTTRHILENDGTILNFVGDAVSAVWGAPLAIHDHARKAAVAAWRLHEASRFEVDGRLLRTRIGLHAGRVLAGNVGSAERFDYAVVGDAANLASRLEGLNKYLGTHILISDSIRKEIDDLFLTRSLGEFRVLGKRQPYLVYELIGPIPADGKAPWIETFARGIEAFRTRHLTEAERRMQETITLRGGRDGPAAFYLGEIARLRADGIPSDWQGIVQLTAK